MTESGVKELLCWTIIIIIGAQWHQVSICTTFSASFGLCSRGLYVLYGMCAGTLRRYFCETCSVKLLLSEVHDTESVSAFLFFHHVDFKGDAFPFSMLALFSYSFFLLSWIMRNHTAIEILWWYVSVYKQQHKTKTPLRREMTFAKLLNWEASLCDCCLCTSFYPILLPIYLIALIKSSLCWMLLYYYDTLVQISCNIFLYLVYLSLYLIKINTYLIRYKIS